MPQKHERRGRCVFSENHLYTMETVTENQLDRMSIKPGSFGNGG